MKDEDHSDKAFTPPGSERPTGEHPSRIGPYRVLDTLGEGGMSVVYLAEQSTPVKRRVALKILKPGMDSKQVVARFESERQALAILDHPNIAKIFEGGIAESGRPYFVMELVKGVPINDYCDDHRLNNEERLEVFIKVCAAVQHAHLKGLIHRDLKPSNILVGVVDGEPQPKIIDFGIAKATTTTLTEATLFTRVGQMVGTPAYMSPEQVNLSGLDIDTRTDIYSLGVVLYELLTGTVPLDFHAIGDQAMQVALREKDPPTPSARFSDLGDTREEVAKIRGTDSERLRQQLRGDLDWIVMCAIEKDRTRRYETVNALAMECRRYLKHEPVLARPPSPGYLLQRFMRRNRFPVLAASIAIFAIVAGAAVATLGYLRATEAEQVAVTEAETAEQVASYLIELFNVSDPSEARGNSITAREILDKGAERIENDLANQPAVQVMMFETAGNVYGNLGLNSKAEELLSKAHNLAGQLYSADDPKRTRVDRSLGEHYFTLGKYEAAEQLLLSVLNKDRATFGTKHERVTHVLDVLARLYLKLDRLDEAREYADQNLAIRFEINGASSEGYARGLHTLAQVMREQGEYAEALEHAKRSLHIFERTLPPNHPSVSDANAEISINLSEQGLLEEQEPYVLRALELDELIYGPEHNYYANTLENVGILYARQGKLAQAEPYFLQSMETTIAALGEVHDSVGFRYFNLGYFYSDMKDFDKAEIYLRRSIDIWTEVFNENHGSNAWAWNALAQNYSHLRRYQDAEDAAYRALKINENTYGPDHQNTMDTVLILANIARNQADYTEALPLYVRAVENNQARFGKTGARTMEVLKEYLVFLELAGMESEAVTVRDRLAGVQE